MTFLISSAWAQNPVGNLDLNSLCSDKKVDQPLMIIDAGFCEQYLKTEMESTLDKIGKTSQNNCSDPQNKKTSPNPWKLRFYASHSFTTYFNSNIQFNSSRYQLEVKDYQWAERSSREFFSPKTWKEPGNNPLQMIDEPSNTFTLSLEKDGHEFFLTAFHPKFTHGKNEGRNATGTVDGVEVNGPYDLNTPFHGYVIVPGESKLVRNENTHKQMSYEVGYGHRFKLMDSKKFGSFTATPTLSGGVMVGQNFSSVVKPGEWWEFDGYQDPLKIQGVGGAVGMRLEYSIPNERFGIFYENKFNYYKMEHGFLDGTQKYNLKYMNNNVGVSFKLYDQNKKKKNSDRDKID